MKRPDLSLYRQLIARMDALHLEPGDFITFTFPERLYSDPLALADAEQFAQAVANLTRHQVLILKEGVALGVWNPGTEIGARPVTVLPEP